MKKYCLSVIFLFLFLNDGWCGELRQPPTKDWTIMVYIAADNDLDPYCHPDLNEMALATFGDKINLIVQVDRSEWSTGRRIEMENGLDFTKQYQDIGEINSGDPAELTKFINITKAVYTAKHYGLIIWSRGNHRLLHKMQIEAFDRGSSAFKTLAFDKTGDRLFASEVGEALKNANLIDGNKLDFIGFDASLMNMLEVWYELKAYAKFGIASEHMSPATGWDYTALIKSVKESNDPKRVCQEIVLDFNRIHRQSGREKFTLSAVDLSKIDPVIASLDKIAPLLEKDKAVVKISRGKMEPYDYNSDDYWPNGIDLYNFLINQKANTKNDILKQEIENFYAVFDHNFVIANVASEGKTDKDGGQGVAIYFPADKATYLKDPEGKFYSKQNDDKHPLAFFKASKWTDFLMNYYGIKPPSKPKAPAKK